MLFTNYYDNWPAKQSLYFKANLFSPRLFYHVKLMERKATVPRLAIFPVISCFIHRCIDLL